MEKKLIVFFFPVRGGIIMSETGIEIEDATDQVIDEETIDILSTTTDEGGEIGSINTLYQQ